MHRDLPDATWLQYLLRQYREERSEFTLIGLLTEIVGQLEAQEDHKHSIG